MATEWTPITLPGCDALTEQAGAPLETAVDWATGEVFTVHPLAARFPLLPDDELAALADDIRANGLAVPVLLSREHELIDGRNRLLACDQAHVEPHYQIYQGDDPAAAIIALNVHRRHMAKGARAMAAALARQFHSVKIAEAARSAEVALGAVGEASIVLRFAPDLVPRVMDGESLKDAYAIAQERKRQQDADAANLKALKTQQPALAAQVEAGTLSIAEAVAAARAIERTAAEEAEIARLEHEIELAREEIGNPTPLPVAPPDLSVRFTEPAPQAAGPTADTLREEHAYLKRMIEVRHSVEALADAPVLRDPSWAEAHLNAVRSAAHGIVTAAYRLVEVHETTLGNQPSIRKVK